MFRRKNKPTLVKNYDRQYTRVPILMQCFRLFLFNTILLDKHEYSRFLLLAMLIIIIINKRTVVFSIR